MKLVIDANALIALIKDEQGGALVGDLLSGNTCYIHAVNLCEIFYEVIRTDGEKHALEVLEDLLAQGPILCDDMDVEFWQQAGRYKADLRRISLADCFCLALAERLDADIVTADHHEFDQVAGNGICKVRFIR